MSPARRRTEALRRVVVEHLAAAVVEGDDARLRDAFVADLSGAGVLGGDEVATTSTRPVRCLRHLPAVLALPGPPSLGGAAHDVLDHVCWDEFYDDDPWSAPFLHDFAVGDAVGPGGRFARPDVVLGLFLLGPHVDYPVHGHAAEEVYVVVQGRVAVQLDGRGPHVDLGPADVSWHAADRPHAARTGDLPVLMAYARRGDLAGPAWRADDPEEPSSLRRPLPLRG